MAKKSTKPKPEVTKPKPTKPPIDPQVISLTDKLEESFIPTGIDEVDKLVGGGFYRGRITELWGKEGVGKTDFVTRFMAHVSKDHKVLYVDSEFALNKDRVRALGADVANISYLADSRLERVSELLIEAVASQRYDVIILDSLAYLTPTTMEEHEVGSNSIGIFARLIKHWVIKFRPRLGVSKTAFVAINQYRSNIALFSVPEPPGGKSWHHAVDLRLLFSTTAADKITKNGEPIGHWVNVEVKKSKVSVPFLKTKYRLEY